MELLAKIEEITKDAGKIMLSATNITDAQHEKSGDYNLVTEYDVKVQRYLFEKLAAVLPEANFIGEEENLEQDVNVSTGYHFVIDPIDGTTNFIHGYQHSSISVALIKDGQIFIGVVYNPYSGELFSAKKGAGAYLNGKAIHTSIANIRETLVAFGTCPYYRELYSKKTFDILRKVFPYCQDIRRSGSAALDLCYVAAGRAGLFFEQTLSPWDFLAGALIIEEAGGKITTMEKEPISLISNCSILGANPMAYENFFELMSY